MTNIHKNQTTIKLNDHEYKLRATLGFLAEYGSDLDKVGDFIKESSKGNAKFDGIVEPLRRVYINGIKAAGDTPDIDQIENDIQEQGIAISTIALQDFYLIALYGGNVDLDAESDNKKK